MTVSRRITIKTGLKLQTLKLKIFVPCS